MIRKLFETSDSREPNVKLEYHENGPHKYVSLFENGERVGVIEWHPAIQTQYRGILSKDRETIKRWGYTRTHANGDRVVVKKRLRSWETATGLVIQLDEKTRQTLGRGRDTHNWEPRNEWTINREGIE